LRGYEEGFKTAEVARRETKEKKGLKGSPKSKESTKENRRGIKVSCAVKKGMSSGIGTTGKTGYNGD